MTPKDESHALAWRNFAADWHLQQEVPLKCGCDDDTPDHELCPASVTHADERFASVPTPELDAAADLWEHDTWVAAWGRNAPLVASPTDYRLPKTPQGMSWLATRLLVGGTPAIELALMRINKDDTVVVAKSRVVAEPTTVVARARRMLQDFHS